MADARCDGTDANGVHDVSAFDFTTPLHVVASYEHGAFVLRPPASMELPEHMKLMKVTRRLDAQGRMVWHRPDLRDQIVLLERISDGAGTPANPFVGAQFSRLSLCVTLTLAGNIGAQG